jgi:hypothetical protein
MRSQNPANMTAEDRTVAVLSHGQYLFKILLQISSGRSEEEDEDEHSTSLAQT